MNRQPATIEHLAFLSARHSVHLEDLFQCLGSAVENGKSRCQTLMIEYRGSIKNEAIFLATQESVVISQFRVDEDFLKRGNLRFENWMDTDKVRRQIKRQNAEKSYASVKELRHGMKKINIRAEVFETTAPSHIQTRWGNNAVVTNVIIGDGTGKIRLCLWNERANAVSKGDTIQITNASVSSYKGERLLRIGKSGIVSVLNRSK